MQSGSRADDDDRGVGSPDQYPVMNSPWTFEMAPLDVAIAGSARQRFGFCSDRRRCCC